MPASFPFPLPFPSDWLNVNGLAEAEEKLSKISGYVMRTLDKGSWVLIQ